MFKLNAALKMIDKYFRLIDQFGEPVSLNYRGYTFYKTKTGAFFTLICVAFISVIVYFKGQKLIYR